jgi:hypothetical protein
MNRKPLLQIGRVHAGHHFQADRYSFTERGRRRDRSLFAAVPQWWSEATPLARFSRVWWWGICAVVGVSLGFVAVALLAGPLFGFR